MTFWQGAVAVAKAIAALPEIYKAFKKLLQNLDKTFGPDWPKRLEELRAATQKWNAAQTSEEMDEAVKAMSAAVNSRF